MADDVLNCEASLKIRRHAREFDRNGGPNNRAHGSVGVGPQDGIGLRVQKAV
jgi:hypothetical protein